jgi:hypothetical protein
MRLRTVLFALLALALTATAVLAANAIGVQTYAAQDGVYGLELVLDGSGNNTYVRDDTPNQETVYRAQFWVDRDGVGSPNGPVFMDDCSQTCSTRFVMFRAADQNHQGGGTEVTTFRLIFGRLAVDNAQGPRYSVRYGVREDDGSFRFIGGIVVPETAQRKWVTIEWTQSDGSSNGIARIYQGNSKGTANLVGERTDLDNDTMDVDFVQLGGVSALSGQPSDPNSSGALFLDSFESFRTLLP